MGSTDPTDDLKTMLAQAMQCSERVHLAIESLRSEMRATYQVKPKPWHNIAWFGGLLLLVLAVLIVISAEALGFHLRETIVFVFLLSLIAIGALAYGAGRLAL